MGKIFSITGTVLCNHKREFAVLIKKVFNGRFITSDLHGILSRSVDFSKDIVVIVTPTEANRLGRFANLVVPIILPENDSYQQNFADSAAILFQLTGGTIVAFDGFAGGGKGTLATQSARVMNGKAIDSGIFYRYLAYYLQFQKKISMTSPVLNTALVELINTYSSDIDEAVLRTPEVDSIVSQWSKIPLLRRSVFELQMIATYASGIQRVFPEGRDMTTELFRKAQFKFFVDAPIELRATWRAAQNGKSLDENITSLAKRDHDDMTRSVSPLFWDEKGGVVKIINDKSIENALQVIKDAVIPMASRV